jgi:hypothetical protein
MNLNFDIEDSSISGTLISKYRPSISTFLHFWVLQYRSITTWISKYRPSISKLHIVPDIEAKPLTFDIEGLVFDIVHTSISGILLRYRSLARFQMLPESADQVDCLNWPVESTAQVCSQNQLSDVVVRASRPTQSPMSVSRVDRRNPSAESAVRVSQPSQSPQSVIQINRPSQSSETRGRGSRLSQPSESSVRVSQQ